MVTDYKKIKEQDICGAAFRDLEAGFLAGRSCLLVGVEESKHVLDTHKGSSEDYPLNALAGDSLFPDLRCGGKDYACVDVEQGKPMPAYLVDPFVRSSSENKIFPEGAEVKPSTDIKGTEVVAELPGLRRRRGSKLDIRKAQSPDGGGEVANGDRKSGSWSVHSKVVPVPSGLEVRQQKSVEKPSSKEVKGKVTQSDEVSSVQSAGKAAGKKGTEPSSVLDTFFQTIVQEPCMSFTNRPGDKPAHYTTWPDVFDHAVVNKIPKSLKIEEMGTKMREGSWEESSTAADSHLMELERDSMISKTKAAGTLGRGGLQGAARDGNLQGLKTVPQAMAVFAQAAAAAKATGKQIPFLDDLTDLPGWPLLSPSKVQLQKCDKCSREFCAPFNHRRHSRMHRRSTHLDKEDLRMKRNHVAAFWDKLLPEEAQRIVSTKNCEAEDLSAAGQSAVTTLSVFLNQASAKSLPHAYLKAGQELLEIVDNRGVFPLPSGQLLNVLDEASEKTFLCGEPPLAAQNYGYQADAGKNGCEEKNLIASLSFIVEQTLVKAWMVDKEAEALRNQQELVKEEEAAQMKRERHFQKKKKKKSRQKGLKERKGNASQLAPHEMENESMEEEGPSPEIVEEDDSPTASSTSLSSSGHEPNLPEPLEIENYEQAGQVVVRDEVIEGEVHTRELSVPTQKELMNSQASHEGLAPGEQQECSQDVDLAGSLHVCCSKTTIEEVRTQKLAFDLVPFDENASGVPEGSQGPVQAQSGPNGLVCLKVEHEEESSVESRGQELEQKVGRLIKDPMQAEHLQSSIFHRTGRNVCGMESRYLEGSHQNFSFKPSRKPSTVSAYSAKAGSGAILGIGLPTPQQYRSKPVTNRSPHVVWTRKTPPQPLAVDSATESLDDESEKSDAAASNLHETVESFPESHTLDVDSVVITSKAPKEERLIFENRDSEAGVSSTSRGVFGGISNMTSMSPSVFNLDTNSEDWPCLPHRSIAQSTNGSKPMSASILSTSSIQPEAGALAMAIDEGSISCPKEYLKQEVFHESLPSTVQQLKEVQTEGCSDSRQVLVGSLTVPLGKFAAQPSAQSTSSIWWSCSSPSLSWVQVASPSHTSVLAAAAEVKHTRGTDAADMPYPQHEHSGGLDVAEAFDGQSKDFSAGAIHYTYSTTQHLPLMSLNLKHLKSHVGSAGEQREREGVLKPGSLLSGTGRFLAAKVWRPVRSGGEHGEHMDSPLTDCTVDENIFAGASATDGSVRMQSGVGNGRNADFLLEGGQYCELGEEDSCHHLQACCSNESRSVHSYERITGQCQSLQSSSGEHKVAEAAWPFHEEGCLACEAAATFHSEEADVCVPYTSDEDTDANSSHTGPAHIASECEDGIVDIGASHSAWIAEALECHYSRWITAMQDPEAVHHTDPRQSCMEVQSVSWNQFVESVRAMY